MALGVAEAEGCSGLGRHSLAGEVRPDLREEEVWRDPTEGRVYAIPLGLGFDIASTGVSEFRVTFWFDASLPQNGP